MEIYKSTSIHIANALTAMWEEEGCYPVSDGNSVYLYKDGLFNEIKNLHGYIMKTCEDLDIGDKKLGLSWGKVTEVGKAVMAHIDLYNPDFFHGAPCGLTVDDGFWRAGEEKLTWHDPSPDHRQQKSYGETVEWEEPENLIRFLAELFGDDEDFEDKVSVIQELLGAALCGLDLQRGVLLYGSGANGKSSLQKIMTEIVGEDATSHVSPSHLGKSNSEYYISQLRGASLNIAGELDATAFNNSTSAIKELIGRDRLIARSPYGQPFYFTPKAIHLFSTNNLPEQLTDHSRGFSRRLVILEFNQSFMGKQKSFEQIMGPIEEERSRVLGWAMRGAARVLAHRDLSVIPRSSKEKFKLWRMSCPVEDFFSSVCEPGGETSARDAMKLFDQFLQDRGRDGEQWGPKSFSPKFTSILSNHTNRPRYKSRHGWFYNVTIQPKILWDTVN